MREKKVIDYARTYRRIQADKKWCVIYIVILLAFGFCFLWFHTGDLTRAISNICLGILQEYEPEIHVRLKTEVYPLFGRITYLSTGTVYPGFMTSLINAGVSLGVMVFLAVFPWKGRPVAIYLTLNGGIHLINSLWFLFAERYFPYTLTVYSKLYMLQEVGIWTMFFIMTVIITGIMGNQGVFYKLLTVFTVMAYSVGFGTVRYVVFIYLLRKFSVLYMALFYFTIGPMFDFLYLVMIYAMFVNRMIRLYDSRKGRSVWKWS